MIDLLKKIKFIDKIFPKQPPEVEVGNREYKLNLDFFRYNLKKRNNILEKKSTQMSYRIMEGGGKAIYFIGLADNGNNIGINMRTLINSIYFFCKIVQITNCKYFKIRIYKGITGYIATIRTYKPCINKHLLLQLT